MAWLIASTLNMVNFNEKQFNFKIMTDLEKEDIVKAGKAFAKGFKKTIPSINGSGWLIVDPLSAYFSAMGIENTLKQIPSKGNIPQVLIMEFKDGSQLIPAGADLKPKHDSFHNWMWI
jgi:hypothetical protein